MNLSKTERLILANQYEILSRITEDQVEKTNFRNMNTIYSQGYSRYYDYHNQIQDELSDDKCKLVVDIINMYDWFYFSYEDFSEDEKEILSYEELKFDGFDLNDSEEVRLLSFAEFVLEDQRKFEGFIERSVVSNELNSHGFGPGIEGYNKMLDVFETIKESGQRLTFEQVKQIINSLYIEPRY